MKRSLPIAGAGKAGPYRLVASFLIASLIVFFATTAALVAAADDLAQGRFAASDVLLAVHLLAVGFMPLAVAGAAFHVLPLVLRGVPHAGRGWATLACLGAGPLLAVGIARHHSVLTWTTAAAAGAGFGLLIFEIGLLVARAPRGKTVVASRFGIAATGAHAVISLLAGGVLFSVRWRPWAGIPHERLIAIHLHVAVVGAVTLLIVTVGRALIPMLATAPAAGQRRLPGAEIALTAGLWIAIAGFASGARWLLAAGLAAVLVAVARFLALVVRTAHERRVPVIEGPLLHSLAGLAFLLQSAVLAVVLLARPGRDSVLTAYAVSLLLGWGAGVTLGHAGKLLSLSAWTWWPPGPRPRQAAFYRRRVWTAEVVAFVLGVELMVAGVLAGTSAPARAGGALLVAAAVLALGGATSTIALDPSRRPGAAEVHGDTATATGPPRGVRMRR